MGVRIHRCKSALKWKANFDFLGAVYRGVMPWQQRDAEFLMGCCGAIKIEATF
jgi:hypothetical protein